MPDIQDETKDMTPTMMAAYYFEKGYSVEKLNEVLRSRKVIFPTISDVLNEFMGRQDMSVSTLAILSDMNQATIHRIMKKERNPGRNAVLRMAIALNLSFDETQVLLKSGNCALLSATRERDLVIMKGITDGVTYEALNDELEARNMPNLNAKI